jgi:hypothetical protein
MKMKYNIHDLNRHNKDMRVTVIINIFHMMEVDKNKMLNINVNSVYKHKFFFLLIKLFLLVDIL